MTIRSAAPDAEEGISYGIPTFALKGNRLSFAAYKKHIGLYPALEGSARFNKKLAPYRSQKATVRFPLNRPMPFGLVTEIAKVRLRGSQSRAESSSERK
jgi:uncharacterized protein YdhG (YjbR/CyaY superfamily)